jgi:hypothetical protein
MIDENGDGRVTRSEFLNACERIGFHGNIKFVWRELDHKETGVIGLVEIDHLAGFLVGEFKFKLMKKYGDMLTAWREGIDTNHSGHVSERELYEAMVSVNLEHLDCSVLYKSLLCAPQQQLGRAEPVGLTLAQFDSRAAIAARLSTEVYVKNYRGHAAGDDWTFKAPAPKAYDGDEDSDEVELPSDVGIQKSVQECVDDS